MVELEKIDGLNIGGKDKIFDKYNFFREHELRVKEMLKNTLAIRIRLKQK